MENLENRNGSERRTFGAVFHFRSVCPRAWGRVSAVRHPRIFVHEYLLLLLCTIVHIISAMSYEWDPNKARSNYKKHRIKFADAVGVFEDENAITIEDDHASENRFITIGRDFLRRILVVVYTFRGVIIRIISARKATSSEKQKYEEQENEE